MTGSQEQLPGCVCSWEASSSPCRNSLTVVKLALTAALKSLVTVLLYLALSPAAPVGRLATIAVAALLRDTHLRRPASRTGGPNSAKSGAYTLHL